MKFSLLMEDCVVCIYKRMLFRLKMQIYSPTKTFNFRTVKDKLTCPLGLQRIVVHSGPVPHLLCSLHKKSEGGSCLPLLDAAQTWRHKIM